MAVTYTMTYADNSGPLCTRAGTFTSAVGDGNGETILTSTHGLSCIREAKVSLNPGGIGATEPKVTYADGSGTVTWTVDDTLGVSGRFWLRGHP